ncbi:hypothetical protein [Inediibacterium massiliense]|uniref:hypothetical protein n=1 Tax=Inediibacterium massiliense TaxID=1658111 RepID=UPI0006B56C0C|nr:hypothetical protein [Inediibacterium massiliense]
MRRIYNNNIPKMMNQFVLTDEQMKEFNELMDQYGNLPDRALFREIDKAKNQVSDELLNQHVKNLELAEKMQGFVGEEHIGRIETVKRILTSPKPPQMKKEVTGQYFYGGTSLLLWFLTLVAIWRRPYFY